MTINIPAMFLQDNTNHDNSILFYPVTLEGRRGTTDEFATIPFHLDLFSAALVELAKSIPVHSLIWSSHLFFCLPLFLFPFSVPCRIVFAKPEDLETWPNHLSFRFLTRVRSTDCNHDNYNLAMFLVSLSQYCETQNKIKMLMSFHCLQCCGTERHKIIGMTKVPLH